MGTWRLKMLLQRSGVWTYRKVVPFELRPFMGGKREVWRSLRTTDLETDKLRAMETGLEVERQLHEARRRLTMRGASMDPDTTPSRFSLLPSRFLGCEPAPYLICRFPVVPIPRQHLLVHRPRPRQRAPADPWRAPGGWSR